MISIGFTLDDLKRALWTFAQVFVVVGALAASDALRGGGDWASGDLWLAAMVAGFSAAASAIKNGLLADGSALK